MKPSRPASAPITGDFWAEGPSPLKIGDQWYVYFDCYREDRYGAVTSRDLKHWTDISDQLKMPPDATHGTAFAVPQGIASILSDVKPAQ